MTACKKNRHQPPPVLAGSELAGGVVCSATAADHYIADSTVTLPFDGILHLLQ